MLLTSISNENIVKGAAEFTIPSETNKKWTKYME